MLLVTANLGTAAQQTWGPGLTLVLSLNLDAGSAPDTIFVYSTEALTPVFTEANLDEVTVDDDTEGFAPSFSMSGDINLAIGETVSLTGVAATGAAGTAGVSSDVSTTISGVDAFSETSQFFQFLQSQSVPATGVGATTQIGIVSVVRVNHVDVPVSGVSASTEVGDADAIGTSVVGIVGTAATSAVAAQTVDLQLSGPITGAAGTASVGILTQTGDAIVSLTGLGVTGTAANMIINPGHEGRVIRRAYPGRTRTVRVGR